MTVLPNLQSCFPPNVLPPVDNLIKQYMIPGDNGKVISNKDMQGGSGGAGTVVQQEIHFHIETTNGIDDATMQKMAAMMKTVSLNTIKDQQRPNGLLRK
ncbi:hypothetical protein FG435_004257 [Yersinia enterocolitica]|nr:hypothetical protein [Yersinia enterocolitica]EKN4900007.1 hypothetical protein [Yersinia enterocolitica]